MLQRRYFVALIELLRDGQTPTQRAVAELAGVEHTRVSKWNRDDAFQDEVARLERRHVDFALERAHRGILKQAERGNVAAYLAANEVLERQGRIATLILPGRDGAAPDAMGGVHVHVHGIPERQPLSTLPPLLTLSAASAAGPSSPAK
jgi:transcriptional regulator with XRE-family HTH domain